jgi:hypothetical protein
MEQWVAELPGRVFGYGAAFRQEKHAFYFDSITSLIAYGRRGALPAITNVMLPPRKTGL